MDVVGPPVLAASVPSRGPPPARLGRRPTAAMKSALEQLIVGFISDNDGIVPVSDPADTAPATSTGDVGEPEAFAQVGRARLEHATERLDATRAGVASDAGQMRLATWRGRCTLGRLDMKTPSRSLILRGRF